MQLPSLNSKMHIPNTKILQTLGGVTTIDFVDLGHNNSQETKTPMASWQKVWMITVGIFQQAIRSLKDRPTSRM